MKSAERDVPDLPGSELWVFAYGSLMWQPDFEYAASAPGRIFGFRRELCLWSVVHRGTSDRPGLVFGLVKGGSCTGRAFRVSPENRQATLQYLWGREMIRNTYIPQLVSIHMSRTKKTGLTFVVDTSHPQFVRDVDDRTAASVIAHSRGRSGHNREYFLDALRKFEEMGIRTERYRNISMLLAKEPTDGSDSQH